MVSATPDGIRAIVLTDFQAAIHKATDVFFIVNGLHIGTLYTLANQSCAICSETIQFRVVCNLAPFHAICSTQKTLTHSLAYRTMTLVLRFGISVIPVKLGCP